MISPEELMQSAIDKCREGLRRGQSPFGCAIAIGDRIVASEHNVVVMTTDITAHAEVHAIRSANRAINSIFLEGAIVATTCEPCPMCMAALHWARVDTVYFGATIADADSAEFNELQLPAAELVRQSGSPVNVVSGVLADECKKLFQEWLANPNRHVY